MNNQNHRIKMLAEGKIGPTLFTLAAPAIVGMMVMAIYSIVDTIFVSLLRDTTAIAATGIVFPIFQLIGAIGLTFGMGAASVISRRLGENNEKSAQEAGATALFSSLIVGLVFSVLGAVFVVPILQLFGATDTIMAQATLYGRVILGGSVFQVVNMTVNNILRSEGASLHSSTGQIIGALLNIILDPLFIFGLNMGITGAAVATVIAQGVSTAYLLSFYFRKKGVLQPLNLQFFQPDVHTYRQLMNLGLPTFVRQILGSISFAIVNNAAATFGDQALAAMSVSLRIFMFYMMGLMGLAQGLQPLVGYNFGAKNLPRVRQTMSLVYRIAIGTGLLAGILAWYFAPNIMTFFTPQDPEVIISGTLAMRIMAGALVPIALVIMFGGYFQALGDGRSALILAAGQQGVFLIPLVLILPGLLGITGVFLAHPLGFVFTFLVGIVLLVRANKKIHGKSPIPGVS